LIYPFALNWLRQAKFVYWCSKSSISYRLAGLPYSMTKIIFQLTTGLPCDLVCMNAEKYASLLHGEELLRMRPNVIFTSDEFEISSFCLYEKLLNVGVRVINTAHGVGQYSPNICYSEFRVISGSQMDFYRNRNPSISYVLLPISNSRLSGLDRYDMSVEKPLALVLVHQPFEESGLIAEDLAMRRMDEVLYSWSRKSLITYFVKMHPNFKAGLFGCSNNRLKGRIILNWNELSSYRLIFFTINSSVVLDARGLGPALVYDGPTFKPSLYFPEPIRYVNELTAEAILNNLIPIENWIGASVLHAGEAIS
jgi:hypothetical protein